MPGVAEVQQLIVDLRLRDQLTGGLGAAKAELAGLEGQAAASTTRVGALGGSLVDLGKVAVGAFAAFKVADLAADFFKGSIEGAREEEASIARLSAALKANVSAWDGDSTAIEQAVRSREALGFSDDQLRTSFGSLVAATHNVNQALEIQNTAMDLARFKGIDLQTATTALIRVEGGRYRALADLGIVLQKGATQTEALAAVQAVAAGQAKAFGDTTEGAMQAAGVAVHDLQEEIGTGLQPVIKDIATGIRTDLIPAVHDLGGAITDAKPVIDALVNVFHLAHPEIDAVTVAQKLARDATRNLAIDMNGLDGVTQQHLHSLDTLGGTYKATTHDLEVMRGAVQANAQSIAGEYNPGLADAAKYLADVGGAATDALPGLIADTEAVGGLAGALARLPTDVRINVTTTFITAGDAFDSGLKNATSGPGGTSASEYALIQADTREKDAADRKAAADAARRARDAAARTAASEALQREKEKARELAAAYKDEVSGAFDKAKRTADSLFDALHARHVKAIKDAENLAEKQHSAAIQQIADALKVQEAQNAAPVNAAEKALRDREQAQQRRGLVESLDAAQAAIAANTDPAQAADLARTLRNATEALQNFDAQAAIDRLTVVQKGLDDKAQGAADAATAKADADLKAAKDKAQKDTDAETIAAGKRKEQFDVALAALKDRDLKANRTPAQLQADIDKLGARFGITTDKFGFHHIDDPLVTAIKTIKIPAPIFTPTINNKFLVTLNGRDVGAALASGTSPSATPAVRSGQGGRR